jgi:hypothetical protein
MPSFHITVSSQTRDQIIDLRSVYGVRVVDHGARGGGETFTVDAIAEPEVIRTLEDAGYGVVVHENLDEAGKRAQADIGKGNRFLHEDGQRAR